MNVGHPKSWGALLSDASIQENSAPVSIKRNSIRITHIFIPPLWLNIDLNHDPHL